MILLWITNTQILLGFRWTNISLIKNSGWREMRLRWGRVEGRLGFPHHILGARSWAEMDQMGLVFNRDGSGAEIFTYGWHTKTSVKMFFYHRFVSRNRWQKVLPMVLFKPTVKMWLAKTIYLYSSYICFLLFEQLFHRNFYRFVLFLTIKFESGP